MARTYDQRWPNRPERKSANALERRFGRRFNAGVAPGVLGDLVPVFRQNESHASEFGEEDRRVIVFVPRGEIEPAVERRRHAIALHVLEAMIELLAGPCLIVNGKEVGGLGVLPTVIVDYEARVVERLREVIESAQM